MHEAFWNGLFDVRWEEAPLGAEAIRLTVIKSWLGHVSITRNPSNTCGTSPGSPPRRALRPASSPG